MLLFTRSSHKSLMSPERIYEVLAQNTQQIIFYSLLKWALLGYEPKRSDIGVFNIPLLLRKKKCK